VQNLTALVSAIPETWIGLPQLKHVTWHNHAPFRDDFSSVGWDYLRTTCTPNLRSLS